LTGSFQVTVADQAVDVGSIETRTAIVLRNVPLLPMAPRGRVTDGEF
jgi:hypothetical protein